MDGPTHMEVEIVIRISIKLCDIASPVSKYFENNINFLFHRVCVCSDSQAMQAGTQTAVRQKRNLPQILRNTYLRASTKI